MTQEWSRTTRIIALVALAMGGVFFVFLGRDLIRPLLYAALLAYVVNPLISVFAGRSRLRRSLAVALLYLAILVGLSALSVALTPTIIDQLQLLVEEFQEIAALLAANLDQGVIILGYELSLESLLESSTAFLPEQILQSELIPGVLGVAGDLAWVLFVMVTTYYMLQDWDKLRDWLLKLPPEELQPDTLRLYEQTKVVWQGYLRGQLLLSTIVALLTGIVMAAIGLPSAGAIAILNGALDFIPTIGPTIVTIIAALIAWFSGSTYLEISNAWFMVIVVILLTLIQTVENVWMRPAVMGRSVRMHPAVVFVAIIGAYAVAGVIGGLIVVPVIATMGIVGRYLRCRILRLDPWLEDEPVTTEIREPVMTAPSGAEGGGEVRESPEPAGGLDDLSRKPQGLIDV
jgi:predicted PurR-regulated permease PerM